ncbi:hypothetical protein DICPUDRAFT_153234 [Dictyostelium purpureum]|uniref:Major facilitator superfamily (MFS) profile domain-containing protein n=1 Tax=Dictyostelium purpureum TaxID=5786 RepID=F0ZND6_DICPU|nr:uncharacterized protein DICPUDRAFT_153234 [Dictyostelium purpureum]EGC34544.1 hypothetical protein DICPUDRAFT_153234 [Dictyostelium purpureum]|eukprot:XP_003288920.1 hypothetical protein DICPUDRAFT_153234 [Dictyostelium purpureum]
MDNNINNKIKLYKLNNEFVEVRIGNNLKDISISIIKYFIKNEIIYLEIENIFLDFSFRKNNFDQNDRTPPTNINNKDNYDINNKNNKINFYREITKFSFVEFKHCLINIFIKIKEVNHNNNSNNNNNNSDCQSLNCENNKNNYNFIELKPNVTDNSINLIYFNNYNFKNDIFSCQRNSLDKQILYLINNKGIEIKSIMFGKEKIVGEEEDETPLLKESSYLTINENEIVTASSSNSSSGDHNESKLSLFLFLNVCFSVLSTLQFGYNTGVISPTIVEIQKLLNLDLNQKSILVSSVLFGAMAGSFSSAFFVDRIGRKWSLLINNFFYILGPFLCSIGKNYVTLLFGRLITGFGVGVASSVVPLYIGEISPTSLRGALGLLRQSTVTFGIMLSSLVAYGLIVYSDGWRYTFAIAAAPSLIQMVLSYWFVETPRYLISKNKAQEAKVIIKKIEPHLSEQQIDMQVSKIKQSINEQKGSDDSWLQLFQIQYIKIYIIAFGLNMLQQLVGINCVIYYSTIILQDAGFVKNTAVLISALVGIPQLIMLLISVWLIDRFGRKPLLIYGLIGMIVGMGILGYPFYNNSSSTGVFDNKAKGWVAVAGMIFFKLMFSVGLGPIPTIITSEIIPSKIRGKAMAISQLLNWLGNCIVNIMYLHMVDSPLGQAGTFWFFGGISLITLLFVIFLVPETKGISIEELSKKLFII